MKADMWRDLINSTSNVLLVLLLLVYKGAISVLHFFSASDRYNVSTSGSGEERVCSSSRSHDSEGWSLYCAKQSIKQSIYSNLF